MQKIFLTSIYFLFSVVSFAQFGPPNVINDEPHISAGNHNIHIADIDGDGDEDVLSASFGDDKIVWYENLGNGSNGSINVISTMADGALAVATADLDGDGDQDVISASYNDDKIAWYENMGSEIFGSEQIISLNADGASFVYSADFDNDNDMDVLSVSSISKEIVLHENLGNGYFGSEYVISSNSEFAKVGDIDGDGDVDVVAHTHEAYGKIVWYENLGANQFGSEQLVRSNPSGFDIYEFQSIELRDHDADGSMEITYSYMNVFWGNDGYIGTIEMLPDGTFNTIISFPHSDLVQFATTRDLDGDGDLDLLWENWAYPLSNIVFYMSENLGEGNFGSPEIILTGGSRSLSVFDFDIDGDFTFILWLRHYFD